MEKMTIKKAYIIVINVCTVLNVVAMTVLVTISI